MAEDLNKLFDQAAPAGAAEDLGALFEQAQPEAPAQTAGVSTRDMFEVGVNPVGVGLRLLSHVTSEEPQVENPTMWGRTVQAWRDATRGAVQGATVGFGDEALAGLEARRALENQALQRVKSWLTGEELPDDAKAGLAEVFGSKYQEERDLQRAVDQAASERNPIAYTTGEVAGGIATSMGLFRGPVTLAKVVAEGAILGGAAGAGFSEADAVENPEDLLVDAAIGGTVGAVAGPLMFGAGKVAGKVASAGLSKAFGNKARDQATKRFVAARSRMDAYQTELGLNPTEAARRAATDLKVSPEEVMKRAVPGLRTKADTALAKQVNKATRKVARKLAETGGGKGTNAAQRLYRSLHESMEKVSPRTAGLLRRHEFSTQDAIRKGLLEGADPQSLGLVSQKTGRVSDSAAVKAWRKVPTKSQTALKKAMANADEAGVDEAMASMPAEVRKVITQWRQNRQGYLARIKAAGHDIEEVEGYYSRVWKSTDDFRSFYVKKGIPAKKVDGAIRDLRGQYGDDIPSVEVEKRAEQLNRALKGRGEAVHVGPTSQMKQRIKTGVSEDEVKHLMDPFEAMVKYVGDVESNLSKRALFGLEEGNLAKSVGAFVQRELDGGWISEAEAAGVQDLLSVRFGMGERASSRPVQLMRNATTAVLLGNVRSAATQLGDIAVSVGYNGARNTLRSLVSPKVFDRYDLGVLDVAAELTGAGRATDALLRASGFKKIDGIGKNVSIGAALNKMRKQVKTERGVAKLQQKYGDSMTPDEFGGLVQALRKDTASVRNEQNDMVRFALFNELSNTQPISLSELPVAFLNNPNGRLFYQMSTFTLKQMGLFRREFLQKMQQGDKTDALKFAARYGTATAFLTGGVEMFKDALTGKHLEAGYDPWQAFGEGGMSNLMMSTIGLNKFSAGQLMDGRVEDAIASTVMPPSVSVLAGITEATMSGKPEKAARYIPFIGPFYRWVTEN